MANPKTFSFQELELSFRQEHGELRCAFVSLTAVRNAGQREIVSSRHISGRPEQIIDEALQHARHLVLEYVLSPEEPF